MSHRVPTCHPIVGLLPALQVMATLGFSAEDCLAGSGVSPAQLNDPDAQVSLAQEIRIFQNYLRLSGDPTIGLQLGEAYALQRYGIFGYAVLSAQTLRQALAVIQNFGDLTFTWFGFTHAVQGEIARFSMFDRLDMVPEVRHLLHDRDIVALLKGCHEVLGGPLPLSKVCLPHDGHGRRQHYRRYFDCPVEFGTPNTVIEFSSTVLDAPLPHRDASASAHLRQQCQLLLSKLGKQSQLIEAVRQLLLARPGYFPDIQQVAERLATSVRSLQRKLKDEGTSFQGVLDEVRCQIAKEYLSDTRLPLHEIGVLLGFNEPANFTHAFKRWAGVTPNEYRRSHSEILS